MKNILYTRALIVCFSSFGQTAREYLDIGDKKAESEDIYGAITYFTLAIEKSPQWHYPYFRRGVQKYEIGDYENALKDFLKSVNLKPDFNDFIPVYNWIANCKVSMRDYYGAITYLTIQIDKLELNSNSSNSELAALYWSRALHKDNLGDIKGACPDYKKAITLGYSLPSSEVKYIKEQCK